MGDKGSATPSQEKQTPSVGGGHIKLKGKMSNIPGSGTMTKSAGGINQMAGATNYAKSMINQ